MRIDRGQHWICLNVYVRTAATLYVGRSQTDDYKYDKVTTSTSLEAPYERQDPFSIEGRLWLESGHPRHRNFEEATRQASVRTNTEQI